MKRSNPGARALVGRRAVEACRVNGAFVNQFAYEGGIQ